MSGLYISNIKLKNFRKFESIETDLTGRKNIIVGKNNTGKTSFVKAIDIFEAGKLSSTDINTKKLFEIVQGISDCSLQEDDISLEDYEVRMDITLSYNENCDFRVINNYMSTIESAGDIKISYIYSMDIEKVNQLIEASREINVEKLKYIQKKVVSLFSYNTMLNGVPQSNNIKVSKILPMMYISANRKVDNETNNKVNSAATKKTISDSIKNIGEHSGLYDIMINAENQSDSIINKDNFFTQFIEKTSELKGLIGNDNPQINIDLSELLIDPKVLLTFESNGIAIPEYNSGLGYANFYSLLLNILSFINEVNSKGIKNSLLIIEEPEAYSHPQMQYIFNDNIEKLLNSSLDEGIGVQVILITHSPQIVTSSNPDELIVFRNINNVIVSKGMTTLIADDKKFFKQYFKLTNSELLFADKVIFIEGDTEEILIKKFFEKYDIKIEDQKQEFLVNYDESTATDDDNELKDYYDNYIPLMSQSISIQSVGTQAYKFKNILESLKIKSLIITDNDFIGTNAKKSVFSNAVNTSNKTINELIVSETYDNDYNLFKDYLANNEVNYGEGNLIAVAHQFKINVASDVTGTDENMIYIPRSFEDAFFVTNYKLIESSTDLRALYTNANVYFSGTFWSRKDVVTKLMNVKGKEKYKKAGLAFEFLISEVEWKIPEYIEKGLEWLVK